MQHNYVYYADYLALQKQLETTQNLLNLTEQGTKKKLHQYSKYQNFFDTHFCSLI
jgi:hypothetical protein